MVSRAMNLNEMLLATFTMTAMTYRHRDGAPGVGGREDQHAPVHAEDEPLIHAPQLLSLAAEEVTNDVPGRETRQHRKRYDGVRDASLLGNRRGHGAG